MELVERYLQAVSFWLPRREKDDIIAELLEDIHAQIEERESVLGRKLKESDVEVILKQRGRPVLVANRYLPEKHLIGPLLFPIYRFVLKVVFACYLLPWLLVMISLMIVDPRYGAEHRGNAWASISGSLWLTAFIALGTVTIIFAIIERVQHANARFLEHWDPRKLPPVRHFNLITRSSSSFELVVNLICSIWWATNMSSPIVLNHPAVQVTLSPLWPYFFWGFLSVALVNTALPAVNLMRPYWTGFRATIRLLSDGAGGVLFCWLLKANIIERIVATNVTPERALQITDAINVWMDRMVPAAIVFVAVIASIDMFRLARLKTTRVRLPWESTVTT